MGFGPSTPFVDDTAGLLAHFIAVIEDGVESETSGADHLMTLAMDGDGTAWFADTALRPVSVVPPLSSLPVAEWRNTSRRASSTSFVTRALRLGRSIKASTVSSPSNASLQ